MENELEEPKKKEYDDDDDDDDDRWLKTPKNSRQKKKKCCSGRDRLPLLVGLRRVPLTFPQAVNSRLFVFFIACFTLSLGDLFRVKNENSGTNCLLISLEKVKRLKNATEMRQRETKHGSLTFV